MSDLSLPVTAKQKLSEGGEKKNPFLSALLSRSQWNVKNFLVSISVHCAPRFVPFVFFLSPAATSTLSCAAQYSSHFFTAHNTVQLTIQPNQQYSPHFSPPNNTVHTSSAATIQQPLDSSQYSYSLIATQCNHTMLSYFWGVGNAGQGRLAKTCQHIKLNFKNFGTYQDLCKYMNDAMRSINWFPKFFV